MPERATRARRSAGTLPTAPIPAARVTHAPTAPLGPHCTSARPAQATAARPATAAVHRAATASRLSPRPASTAATSAAPAGTATTTAHGPATSTPVHTSGGSSVTDPATTRPPRTSCEAAAPRRINVTGSPPSSTAPRSARHHGSTIAAAATAASPAVSAIPAQERGGAGWAIAGSSRDRQSASPGDSAGHWHINVSGRSASHCRRRPSSTGARAHRAMIGRARRAPVAAGLRWCSVTGDLSTGGAAPSVFPALEALLPRVAKPVQYVGGELNARAKPWDAVQVRWALMYPDAYEVGLPNQGIQILYEILNERPDALAERCYAVWPDLEALMREARVPAFTVDAHRPLGAFDALGVSFATELGYTNLLTALDLAGIPLHAADRDEHHPIVVAGGHAAFNPEPIADFVDVAAIGDGEEVVGDITDVVRDWKAAGRPGGRRRAAAAARGGPGLLRAVALRRLLRPGRRDRRGAARRPARPAHGAEAHHRGPRLVALPEDAAGADGRDRARARERRDLPRLHPRLPLLPGRHDHPAGARAVAARDRRDGRLRGPRVAGSTRSGSCRCPARTTRRSPRSPRAWPTATRAPTRRCRCPAPGSTRSTSTSPTRSAATAAAPA